MKIEHRFGGEIRAHKAEGGPIRLVGHAAVFNRLSEDLGGFRESVAPGAFAGSLTGDVRALFNHSSDIILGRTNAGTLRLAEDSVGLAVEIDLPETRAAQDLAESIDRGDVDQMSFGFRVITDKWTRLKNGDITRELQDVTLFDVSPVVFPAYPQTDIGLRSLAAFLEEEVEDVRQARLSLTARSMRLALAERV